MTVASEHDNLLRLIDVREITKLGSSTIYRKIADGSFPKPRKLSENCVRWKQSDIKAWIDQLPPA